MSFNKYHDYQFFDKKKKRKKKYYVKLSRALHGLPTSNNITIVLIGM